MRTFGPKSADHPSVGKECVVCLKPLAVGDFTTLIALGPDPDDTDAVHKALVGEPYNARAVEIHANCVDGVVNYYRWNS